MTATATLKDARRILSEHACTNVKKIISCDDDSIMFITRANQPRTAWLRQADEKIDVKVVVGFQAIPPAGWGA